MREIIEISTNDVKPATDDVLKTQGVPAGKASAENIKALIDRTMELFLQSCKPVGIISGISIPEFEIVYQGEGLNEKETPLDRIFRKANNLALFAVTLGQKVTDRITELFAAHEFALGSMLDSFASMGTEKAADFVESHFLHQLLDKGITSPAKVTSIYSPGYCGWHVSGQRKLFAFLHPEDIGITLLDSFLMRPLKSISGVIVVGKKEIHILEDSYPFCGECKTRSCRDRIGTFFRESRTNNEKGAS
jgi:hypothetical protein